MERKEQEPSGKSPQAAEGGHNQLLEKKRAIVALTRILGSGPLDEESLRLLEQLADCIQRPHAEMIQEAKPAKQAAAQQVTTAEEESAETEPAKVSTGELSSSGNPSTTQRKELSWGPCAPCQRIGGRARCRPVQGGSTASRTAGVSIKWNRKKDSGWQIYTVFAWGV
jgi:hypothetical protein